MLSHARNTHELYPVTLDKLPAAANRMGDRMLDDGLKYATVNRRLAVVRRVLNLSYKQWDLIDVPLAAKVLLHSEKGTERQVFLSPEDVKVLVSGMQSTQAKHVVLLAAYTGLRRGEILKLQPSNWQTPYIVLSAKTKNGKVRSVPVRPELEPIMGTLPFTLTEHELRSDFESAREAANMKHVRLHDLRHTFASWLMAQPHIPIAMVRDLLGHSSLAVTSKYSHLRSDTADKVFKALGHIDGHMPKLDIDDK